MENPMPHFTVPEEGRETIDQCLEKRGGRR